MDDVVAGGPGFVAVGAEAFPEGEFRRLPIDDGVIVTPPFGFTDAPVRGAIWTSGDGLVWTRVPDEQLPGTAAENVRLIGVATGGPGLVAVGWRGHPEDRDAVVWTSADGETWSLATDLGGALRSPGDQVMLDVIAGGPGLVAVGTDGSPQRLSTGVWTSPGAPAFETAAVSEAFDLQAALDDYAVGQPGGVVALTVRGGVTATAAAGAANAADEPLRPDTPFRIPDVFIRTMVLQLADDGLIDLDEPLATYLPDAVVGGEIPIRSLLNARYMVPILTDTDDWGSAALGDPSRSFTAEELLAFVVNVPLRERFPSSPKNNFTETVLLRQLIEELDGIDIRTALQTRIVEPLGLESTVFPGNGTPVPEGTVGAWSIRARLVGDPATPVESMDTSLSPAISTANDLRVFLEALFAGDLISEESLAEMTAMDPDGEGIGVFAATLGPSGPGFGFGTGAALVPEVERPGFGRADFGVGYQFLWTIEPPTGDLLVILTNNDDPPGGVDSLAGQVFRGWARETTEGS